MRRYAYPWVLSAAALIIGLATTVGLAWFIARQGHDIGSIGRSILPSTYPDEVIPRLAIAVVFFWGLHRLIRSGSRRQVLAAAVTCAAIGMLVAGYVIVRAELGYAQAFPDDGAGGGWAPGAARAAFMPAAYLVASVQAVLGLLASSALLTIIAFRRSPA